MKLETYGPRTAAWRELTDRSKTRERSSIKALFATDAKRFLRFSLDAEGILLDFSRQLLDAPTLESLVALAEQTEVPRWIELMFGGHPINNTEDRPALHVALRRSAKAPRAGEDNPARFCTANRRPIVTISTPRPVAMIGKKGLKS